MRSFLKEGEKTNGVAAVIQENPLSFDVKRIGSGIREERS